MANAAGDKSERGEKKPSQQGQAGLRLQHALHDARILYVSATGATTIQNLAYAARLGLWSTGDFPFATRAEFVAAMEKGGVAAMEVLARDLKALGLYAARSLSFEGIEYEIVEHALTPEQIRIYDAYADAFQIIHKNLNEALKAANITGESGATYNRNAKAAARSAFEANKQRFFNHLLTAMKCPTLIAAIARDLDEGHASILQIVSTNEALLDRRLAEIPTSEWGDLTIDITPREYVLDYLQHSFPTQLFELFSDDEGNLHSRPAHDEAGNPVISREAVDRRDRMIEHLASLPPVQGALDQILHRFGTDLVAEVTGRSRRIVRCAGESGDRLSVESRPASANFAETAAFMDDDKRILVFSDAGGTGRSYHADLGCRNQRQRIHYLLEPALARRMRRSRDWGARTAPTRRNSRRCSGRSRPTSKARSVSCRRSPAVSTVWVRSPAASARPAARASSAPTTISKAPMRKPRCVSSTSCFTPARSKAAHLTLLRTQAGSISVTGTANCARNCRRSRNFSIACFPRLRIAICRTRSTQPSNNCSRPASRPRSPPAPTISASRH